MTENFVGIDKNGTPLHAGDIVKIENAYFNNDNGLYFVECAPNESPNWTASEFSLLKLNKNGTLSKSKYNRCSWPISIYVNNWAKRQEAKEWNKNHATIEIVTNVNPEYVAEYFTKEAIAMKEIADNLTRMYGSDDNMCKPYKKEEIFNKTVADKVREHMRDIPDTATIKKQ